MQFLLQLWGNRVHPVGPVGGNRCDLVFDVVDLGPGKPFSLSLGTCVPPASIACGHYASIPIAGGTRTLLSLRLRQDRLQRVVRKRADFIVGTILDRVLHEHYGRI